MNTITGGTWLEGNRRRRSKRYTAQGEKLDCPRKRVIRPLIGTSTRENTERNTEKRSERGTAGIITRTEKKDLKRGEYTARRNGGKEMELIAWLILLVIAIAIAKWIDNDVDKRGK